jgi:AraC family transcriptional regulator
MIPSLSISMVDAEQGAQFDAVLLPRTPYEARYTAPCGIIGFAFESQSGTHSFGSDRRTPFRARPNSLSYIPPGCDVYSRSLEGGEYLLIRTGHWQFPEAARFNDLLVPGALAAACQIRCMLLRVHAAAAADVADSAGMEEPLHALTAAVAPSSRLGRGEPQGEPPSARWMTTRRLRLIDELIEAHMHRGVTVSELARQLGLSIGFFIRAFGRGVGRTPHDYVMERRLSRARLMLSTSAVPLADVAAACGFASQAHMSTVFKKRLSLSPGALRRAPC